MPKTWGQRKSRAQEKRGARDWEGGRRQPASGAMPLRKGDVEGTTVLAEYKTTSARQYTLHLDDLMKIAAEGAIARKEGVFVFQFQGQAGQNKQYLVGEYHREVHLRRLEAAIAAHKKAVWGDGPVENDEDIKLYAIAGV